MARASNVESATLHYTVSAHATNPLDPPPIALRCDASGTATIVDNAGTSIEYNLLQGEIIYLQGDNIKVTAAAATLIAYHG